MTLKDSPQSIGIIGLGIMGGTMAKALMAHGHQVVGYDIEAVKRRRLDRMGGQSTTELTTLLEQCQLLITALPTPQALLETVHQIASQTKPIKKQVLIETSTFTLEDKLTAKSILDARKIEMIDAPISGTSHPDPASQWIIFVSGGRKTCRSIEPILRSFSVKAPWVGEFGEGIKLKLVANHLVAILNVAAAEATAFSLAMGLNPQTMLEHIGQSPYIGTGLMRIRVPMMIQKKFKPATMKIEVWQKDMDIIGEMMKSRKFHAPLFQASASIYDTAQSMGFGDHDTASVSQVLSPSIRRPRS
jgi:putative dehydrogenase